MIPVLSMLNFAQYCLTTDQLVYRRATQTTQGPKGGWGPQSPGLPKFCFKARSPDDFDAPNEMLWSPGAPIYLSWSPGAPYILGGSPGALNPFGTLTTETNIANEHHMIKTPTGGRQTVGHLKAQPKDVKTRESCERNL